MRRFLNLALFAIFIPTFSHTEEVISKPTIDPNICSSIAALNPFLSDDDLIELTSIIETTSKAKDVDWRIPVAIFKQESNFNYNAVNYATRDFGLGQMHYKTIQSRNIDLGKLLTVKWYAVDQTLQLLRELQQKYAKIDAKSGRKWYTRYHSFTPIFRDNYRKLLNNHFKVIEETLHVKEASSKRGNEKRNQRSVCLGW